MDSEDTEKIQSRSEWFGIVDREQTWYAETDLLLEDPDRWEGIQWPDTRLV